MERAVAPYSVSELVDSSTYKMALNRTMLTMAESLFRYIVPPSSLLLLMIGGMMLWDILSAYGMSRGPDGFSRRNWFFGWLLNRGRLGQDPPATSKPLMWWRLLHAWGLGGGMFVGWLFVVYG